MRDGSSPQSIQRLVRREHGPVEPLRSREIAHAQVHVIDLPAPMMLVHGGFVPRMRSDEGEDARGACGHRRTGASYAGGAGLVESPGCGPIRQRWCSTVNTWA